MEPWIVKAAIICGLALLPVVGFLLWRAGYEQGRRDRAYEEYEDYQRGRR